MPGELAMPPGNEHDSRHIEAGRCRTGVADWRLEHVTDHYVEMAAQAAEIEFARSEDAHRRAADAHKRAVDAHLGAAAVLDAAGRHERAEAHRKAAGSEQVTEDSETAEAAEHG